jgi:hypothetical protein
VGTIWARGFPLFGFPCPSDLDFFPLGPLKSFDCDSDGRNVSHRDRLPPVDVPDRDATRNASRRRRSRTSRGRLTFQRNLPRPRSASNVATGPVASATSASRRPPRPWKGSTKPRAIDLCPVNLCPNLRLGSQALVRPASRIGRLKAAELPDLFRWRCALHPRRVLRRE